MAIKKYNINPDLMGSCYAVRSCVSEKSHQLRLSHLGWGILKGVPGREDKLKQPQQCPRELCTALHEFPQKYWLSYALFSHVLLTHCSHL